MSATGILFASPKHRVESYDVTVTTASTSSVATASLTFDVAFGITPDVFECDILDGTKNRSYDKVQVESVGPTGLGVYLRGDSTLTDGTVNVHVVIHSRFP